MAPPSPSTSPEARASARASPAPTSRPHAPAPRRHPLDDTWPTGAKPQQVATSGREAPGPRRERQRGETSPKERRIGVAAPRRTGAEERREAERRNAHFASHLFHINHRYLIFSLVIFPPVLNLRKIVSHWRDPGKAPQYCKSVRAYDRHQCSSASKVGRLIRKLRSKRN